MPMAWQMWVVRQGNLCVPKEKEKKKPYFQRNDVGKVFNVQKTISKKVTKFIILM